jgi:hypothetical protein
VAQSCFLKRLFCLLCVVFSPVLCAQNSNIQQRAVVLHKTRVQAQSTRHE